MVPSCISCFLLAQGVYAACKGDAKGRSDPSSSERLFLVQRRAEKLGNSTSEGLRMKHQDPHSTCTQEAWDQALASGKAQQWDELVGNPCTTCDTDIEPYKNGLEDSEDFMEALASPNYSEADTCTKELMPKLMYMGLPHAGSTLFADLLNTHPELSYGGRKEHHYWSSNLRDMVGDGACMVPSYKAGFRVPCGTKTTFDADPATFFIGNGKLRRGCCRAPPGTAAIKELRSVLGDDVRFILTIRDPVDWINSLNGASNLVLRDVSCFADSLETWLEIFAGSQFLFFDFAKAMEDPISTLDRMLKFANVSPRQFHVDIDNAESGRRRSRQRVSDEFRKAYHSDPRNVECKRRLESLTGLNFEWSA